MKIGEIIEKIGHEINTPNGNQLLAGLQIGVLMENTGLKAYPRSISLICWSKDGGKYHYDANDCEF